MQHIAEIFNKDERHLDEIFLREGFVDFHGTLVHDAPHHDLGCLDRRFEGDFDGLLCGDVFVESGPGAFLNDAKHKSGNHQNAFLPLNLESCVGFLRECCQLAHDGDDIFHKVVTLGVVLGPQLAEHLRKDARCEWHRE